MTSGNINGSYNILAGDEAELIGGGVYVNLHTVNTPTGEIRGQLALTLASDCEVEIESGDLCIGSSNRGLVLKSPNGTCYRLKVDNTGNLITQEVSCP